MKLFQSLANNLVEDSFANKLRKRRFQLFLKLLESVPSPKNILDVGGTESFWMMMGYVPGHGDRITLLNLTASPTTSEHFVSIVGDARDLHSFKDDEFDVVFSNSVIEHVGSFEDQRAMAEEIQRVGQRYFVQTPNFWFPVEPHFLLPGFQFLPRDIRLFLVRHCNLGWYSRIPDRNEAEAFLNGFRLLRKRELIKLFPVAEISNEKFCGLTKSFMLYEWPVS